MNYYNFNESIMVKFEKQKEIISDLILINNDRIEGYQKAKEELNESDKDLAILFNERIDQSILFRSELISLITLIGGKVPEGTKFSGKIYRAWMDVKAFFSGSDRKVILDNCEDGEDAALSAYEEALSYEHLTPEQKATIFAQKSEIKMSHDKIKMMRDSI